MNVFLRLITYTALSCAMAASVGAAHLISYQGRLGDSLGGPTVDSVYSIQFAIYNDSTSGFVLWTESAQVQTNNGLFYHLLGSTTPLDDSVFQNYDNVFLELSADGESILPRSRLATIPYAVSSANLEMKDNNNKLAALTNSEQHSISIFDTSETEVIRLSGSDTANESVVLPESAIDYSEILDEPGLTAEINVNQVALFTGEMTDLVTIDITTPAEGYILLHGKCYLLLSGTTGPNNAFVQIDDDEAGPSEFPYYTIAGLSGYANTGTNYFPVYVTRIFFRPAGTHTFRMEGRASFAPPAEAKTWDHYLTAVYYPTAYNAVKSLMATPAGFVSPIRIDVTGREHPNENGTYYETDLRELEKKKSGDKK